VSALLDEESAERFDHEALFYRGDDDFLAGVVPFVRDGLSRGEAVVVAEPRRRLDLLRDALGDDAEAVELLDMGEIGGNPARIIGVWAAALEQHTAAGRRMRGVGEPAWPGRRTAELQECQLHELLLDATFTGGPAWRLMCPYDEEHLPRSACQGALRSHPVRSTSTGRRASGPYTPAGWEAAFGAPLPAPTDAVLRGRYADGDVPAARRTVASWARTVGLADDVVANLELAASELATNSIRHGGGSGTVAMWTEPGAAVVEFSDAGRMSDPLLGRLAPAPDGDGGFGLYLVNQLCDLVQVRSSADGTTVRLTTWR
jgi:anti-sigma regulatory factor (Ser/Thr protein kinase)